MAAVLRREMEVICGIFFVGRCCFSLLLLLLRRQARSPVGYLQKREVHKERKVKMLINRPLLRGGEETSDALKEAIKTTDHKKDI